MARPSKNVDQLLLQAGHDLLPGTGVKRLSIRQVVEHAGVNLGMFHYHFKSKDIFVRAVLQEMYNNMFSKLELASSQSATAINNLHAAANMLARFVRDNRQLLLRLLNDSMAGETVAIEFLRANVPRHLSVVAGLITRAQQEGAIKKMPLPQAKGFLLGSVGVPILVSAALTNSGFLSMAVSEQINSEILTDAAINERVEMALAGMAVTRKTGVKK